MKIERSKEWWMARARREGDAAVGAGLLAFDPVPDERPTTITQTAAAEPPMNARRDRRPRSPSARGSEGPLTPRPRTRSTDR